MSNVRYGISTLHIATQLIAHLLYMNNTYAVNAQCRQAAATDGLA